MWISVSSPQLNGDVVPVALRLLGLEAATGAPQPHSYPRTKCEPWVAMASLKELRAATREHLRDPGAVVARARGQGWTV